METTANTTDLDPNGTILAEVRDMAPVSVRDIAAGTGIPTTTVGRILRSLEKEGLVEWENYQRRARVWMPCEPSNRTSS